MAGAGIHHQAVREPVERVALFENALGNELQIVVGKSAAQDRRPESSFGAMLRNV